MRGKYLTKSPERIIEELYTIPEKFVRFADGNTFGNPRRMARLCEPVRRVGLKKKYMFDIRSDTVVEQSSLISKWREIGLDYVAIGLESIRDDQLKALNKRSTLENNERAIEILHDNDVKIIGQFMIDQNYDRKDFEGLLEFVIKHRIHLTNYNITTPYPGTPFFMIENKNSLRIITNILICFTQYFRQNWMEKSSSAIMRNYLRRPIHSTDISPIDGTVSCIFSESEMIKEKIHHYFSY